MNFAFQEVIDALKDGRRGPVRDYAVTNQLSSSLQDLWEEIQRADGIHDDDVEYARTVLLNNAAGV